MQRVTFSVILVAAALLAHFTARPYAGSWNDGSRLAMVESLGDRGTFQIDDSIYVHPETAALAPYAPGDELLARDGTKDKLFIDGHYYSDKSPVPGVLMAGAYKLMRWCGLPAARERPDWFARILTWLFAGGPFVLAVWCVRRIAMHLAVPHPWDVVLIGGFAFGSLALPYAQHVNNHVLLLAVAAAIGEAMTRIWKSPSLKLRAPMEINEARSGKMGHVWFGMLAGLGYTIDLGAGPLLLATVGGWVFWQRKGLIVFAASALPFVAAHHAINYAIAGTFVPANSNPEYFLWPGSPFHPDNMTGTWRHSSPERAALYGLDLLFGKKGFLLFSLPLVQAVVGCYWLLRNRTAERPVLVALGSWAAGTWFLYAATSTNHSGTCLSVRWFVPLLVPGFVALMLQVRDYPRTRRPLLVLVAGSVVLNSELVVRGPWSARVPILLWPVVAVTLTVWVSVWLRAFRSWRRNERETNQQSTTHPAPSPTATTG